MPSGGYGAGDPEDANRIAKMITQLEPGEQTWIPTLMMTYIAARLQGASPDDAALAAWIEWDL